jgi:site-specific DNA-methyltransferase (adenine-specific)
MWEELERVIKPSGAIVMTSSQPFTTTLIASNMKMFKYSLVWKKDAAANFLNFKYQFGKIHEDICVFGSMATSYSKKGNMQYYPQMVDGKAYTCKSGKQKTENNNASVRSKIDQVVTENKGERYPNSILEFKRDKSKIHPTQKPVALMEYLIKTYSNEGETVLDFTMGSGSTGVAAKNLNRNFIGIELDDTYFNIAKERIDDSTQSSSLDGSTPQAAKKATHHQLFDIPE